MLHKLKLYLENIHVTPISWLAGVSGVLIVRFFLESLSNPSSSGFFASDASTLVNYYLFFMTSLLIFMVFLQIAIPSWRNVAPQFVALSSVAVFIAPIIDWVVSGGKGLKMTYLFDTPTEMIYSFLHFFDKSIPGVTIGLKIEIILGLVLFGVFVYLLERKWKRAVISSFVLYLLVFILASIPGIISMVFNDGYFFATQNPLVFLKNTVADSLTISNNIHSSLQYYSAVRLFEIAFNFIMGKILFLISTATLALWFFLNFKEKLKAVIRNLRMERVAAYVIMIFLGVLIAGRIFPAIKLNWNDWLSVIVLALSFVFSCLFAICVNDLADEDTDKVSNADRPLISKTLSGHDMKQMGFIFLVVSLISAYLAGYTAFFFVLTFTSLYYIYSAPPTRFKLVPLLSSFLISLCMLSAILAGFFIVSPLKYVSVFPARLILAIVVVFSLLANVREMKDVEGDRTAGIKTLPVLLGNIWGPRVVAICAVLSFILIPIFSSLYVLFMPAVPTAILSWYFINKKPYSEKPLVRVYFAFIFVSFLLLFL